ncbi:hypothetical protein HY256_02535, partial [Candidatus Sumerlaeota bacterium]|nr:hypothetical protein [Candidatus Sumerlaeota bacterium]
VILSILWAFVALGGAVGHRKEAEDWAEMVHRKRTSSFGVIQSHVFALLLGWILAWFCMAFTEIQSAAAGKSDAAEFALAQEAVGRLWPKSLLFGWGRGCLVRLTEAVTEPMPAKFSGWGGWLGTLGAFGLSSAVFAVFLSFTLMWLAYRRNRIYRLSLSSAPQLCLLAAQTLLALIVLGGPDSSVPIFFLFGWIGLGLASGSYSKPLPGKPFEDEESYSQLGMLFRFLAAVCLTMLFLAGTIAALGPVWSASMIGSLKLEDFRSAGLGRKLGTAKLLSPWDPEVEIKEAMRLREELQKTPIQNWDENLFQRTCDAYRRAQNLDRFDPKIPIQLANLQALAKRPDDAIKTILRALAVTPSDEVLLDWLFLYANRQNNSDVVMDMINRGLQLQPSSSKWWQRRYRFEFMTGRGPQAGHTLNTALTAAPGDLNLLHAAMDRNLLAGRSQPVTQ